MSETRFRIFNQVFSAAAELLHAGLLTFFPALCSAEQQLHDYGDAGQQEQRRHICHQASGLAASAAARSRLAAMLDSGNLREIFGSEIAGIPTETILEITRSRVWAS